MRYIRAGGCGIFGLLSLFTIFAMTSVTVLTANWWLGRWSNSERIRYRLTNTTETCSSIKQSAVSNMTNEEWFAERDKFFYVLFGKYPSFRLKLMKSMCFIGLSSLSAVLLFVRTMTYFISCHLTARSLHNQMFIALLRAPVFFFDSNPIGKRTNIS
jgi:hypothetical protein